MEKIIEIDLSNKYDFIEKYNEKKISNDIIEYVIKQITHLDKKAKIKIRINKKCKIESNCTKMLKEGIKEELNNSLKKHYYYDLKQFLFLILGIVFIFLSTLIKEDSIWKEILLISGWVPIWEMIELELFADTEVKKKRRILKKLLKSEIIEKSYEQ